MIVASMNISEYNFKRCKLCGEMRASPRYQLPNTIIYSCQDCTFHFINNFDEISEAAEGSGQLNQKSIDYIESRIDEGTHLHPLRIKFAQSYTNFSDGKALDIGAGLGHFQQQLNAHGVEVHGIEPSTIRRKYAEEKMAIQLRSELVDDQYWQIKYRHYFDLITLWDVIEHVNFPRETLESAINLLKPGGLLCLETPSRETLSYKISQSVYRFSAGKMSLFLPSFYSTAPFGHKQIFTSSQLIQLLQKMGMSIIFLGKSYINPRKGNKIIIAATKKEH